MGFKEEAKRTIWVKVLNDYSRKVQTVCYMLFMNADCVKKEYYGDRSWLCAEVNIRSYTQIRHKLDEFGVIYLIEE